MRSESDSFRELRFGAATESQATRVVGEVGFLAARGPEGKNFSGSE